MAGLDEDRLARLSPHGREKASRSADQIGYVADYGLEDSSYATSNMMKNLVLEPHEVVEYCPNADVFMFIRNVEKVLPWIFIGMIPLFAMASNPATSSFLTPVMESLGHAFLSPLKPLLVGHAAGSTPALVLHWLTMCSWFLYGLLGIFAVSWVIVSNTRPTHVALIGNGLYVVRHLHGKFYKKVKVIPWNELDDITVERPLLKKSSADYELFFHGAFLGREPYRLRYGDVFVPEERDYFISFLRQSFDGLDDDEIEALKPPAENLSYTELWLLELSAPPKRDKLTPLSPGTVLNNGKYRVISKIGVGGQGTVYNAHASLSDSETSEVVLKEFVLPVFPDARVRRQSAEKFQEEANMLSRLSHPQIVDFLDLFVEDHRAYLVLEKVEGQTLKDLVANEGAQPEDFVHGLTTSMCEILKYLHGQEPPIIHRDFTPDNLILEPDGKVKLLDFSVAQRMEESITGSVVGKAHYISPEQFRGKPTEQSDIYSLGATMFFLLTGQDPEPISRLRPAEVNSEAVSAEMSKLVESCTDPDLERRFPSIQAVLSELRQISKRA